MLVIELGLAVQEDNVLDTEPVWWRASTLYPLSSPPPPPVVPSAKFLANSAKFCHNRYKSF